ncbi:MAG: response regulator [Pseudobutyrivibrio sp.]|nr:response regulator [Pseudobutyrivibrio sp.]
MKKKVLCKIGVFAMSMLVLAGGLTADGKELSKARNGGGYAASKQLNTSGYAAKLYNANSGMPTSDANCILADDEGYIWIGGYSGVILYDGTTFERLDSKTGLTNANTLFEDSQKRLWVGTNDNGLMVIYEDGSTKHFSYDEGLDTSSIRTIVEDGDGNIIVGTTTGLYVLDQDLNLSFIDEDVLNDAYIMRLVSDSDGTIYGNTRSGKLFCIKNKEIVKIYGEELGIGAVSNICADPKNPGYLYIGVDPNTIYYGSIEDDFKNLKSYNIDPAADINSIDYACDRIWVLSDDIIGYLDGDKFCVVEDLPMDSNIGSMTEDYQGNLWFTSTRQGVMKIVTNNFKDLTMASNNEPVVVNATCISDRKVYVGTDEGLQIYDKYNRNYTNALTEELSGIRIRCISKDLEGNLWISTYTGDKGLICYTKDEQIISYNEANGFISNGCRCTTIASDGSVLAATNGGFAVIKDGQVTKTISKDTGVTNDVFLTVEEGDNGDYYLGTDGDGIYIVHGDEIIKKGREDGLKSDVILRIKKDPKRNVYWIVTSNSIAYMKDNEITTIEDFPYSNSYDIYYDDNGNLWVLASNGIYVVDANMMLKNDTIDYKYYSTDCGLPSLPTGNSFSDLDDNGNIFISCREGVSRVNINGFFERNIEIKTDIENVYVNGEYIEADENDVYVIPADADRIQFNAAILNYSLCNPKVHMYIEGDKGVITTQKELTGLEYTKMPYGNYKLHVQILNNIDNTVLQDDVYQVYKKPQLYELLIVRLLILLIAAAIIALFVWRVMANTIIRRQYEQIRIAKEEAERANSAKSRFLANISHEIRTPINTIMGMDEMILREESKGVPKPYYMSIVGYALDIKTASDTLLGIINDILDLSKIESGKMNLVEQEYNVDEQLKSVISMIKVRAAQKELTFDWHIDKNIPKVLYGDAGKIKQIVLNLLSNAVKYTEKGGFTLTINIIEKTDDECVVGFEVKDTGIGIKEECIDRLFDAFERLDERRNNGIQGTGLGLNISKQFAELMNGTINVESEYGKGSTFSFSVKQKIINPEIIGESFMKEEPVSRGPYIPQFIAPDVEVLVVDDDPMNLTVIKNLLSATKMYISTASSGEEALEKINFGTYNVILLDHMMPGMDGIETIGHIRKTHPDLPVVALTANAATNGEEYYKSFGFTGYLAKPVDGKELEKTILQFLPKDMVELNENAESISSGEELPSESKWLNNISEIDVNEGIRNSGGVKPYLMSIEIFYETIDENIDVIKNAYVQNDINLYTVKVHALKSAARIIGATKLSDMAKALEDAGKAGNIDQIQRDTKPLLEEYKSFKSKLSPIKTGEIVEASKEMISEEDGKDAINALKELVWTMDYDGIETVLQQLEKYDIPADCEFDISSFKKAYKLFDWDKMENLLG